MTTKDYMRFKAPGILRRLALRLRHMRYVMVDRWRSSVQLKMVGQMFAASAIVMIVSGYLMVFIMSDRLCRAKEDSADLAIERARHRVEQQIDAWDTSNSVQVRINAARASLTDHASGDGGGDFGFGMSMVYEPVLIVPTGNGDDISSPEDVKIPNELRRFVAQDQVAYQWQTVTRSDGVSYRALIIGTPVSSEIQDLELYLILPADNEEATLAMIRGLVTTTGIILLVLLVGITWYFSARVTAPVRSASRIAERLAAGHLKERMTVEGQDEMARLAVSFNQMAESLSTQINQLEEYSNLQKQFTSDVSHELRTPLTTVRMAADIIWANADDLDPNTRRAAELMISELDRFEMLLNDLLEISRHDANKADLSLDQVDIRGCVHAAWLPVRAVADELGVPVRFHLPDQPVNISVDSRRVERILRNLLANAVDHSEGRPVDVGLKCGEHAVSIVVLDHGVGLKPGQESLVFNRFWRADPSRVRHTGGTGLGLAIAREDAVLHGGLLEAAGEPGVGSCFRLTLPTEPKGHVDYLAAPLPLTVGPEADEAVAECGEPLTAGAVGLEHLNDAPGREGAPANESIPFSNEGIAFDDEEITEEELRAAAEFDDFEPIPEPIPEPREDDLDEED